MQCFAQLYGLETVSLRYFTVFGPRQSSTTPQSGVLARFIGAMLSRTTPDIYGNGMQTRDFIFIDDVVEATLLAAVADSDRVSGRVFNVGSGVSHSLLEAHQMIADIMQCNVKPRFLPNRVGDICHSRADLSLARQYLGFEPQISFRAGLERTIDWYSDGRRQPAELLAFVG
jgi:UDP-glucose 4-epimerase